MRECERLELHYNDAVASLKQTVAENERLRSQLLSSQGDVAKLHALLSREIRLREDAQMDLINERATITPLASRAAKAEKEVAALKVLVGQLKGEVNAAQARGDDDDAL